jgi:hypothetical protein
MGERASRKRRSHPASPASQAPDVHHSNVGAGASGGSAGLDEFFASLDQDVNPAVPEDSGYPAQQNKRRRTSRAPHEQPDIRTGHSMDTAIPDPGAASAPQPTQSPPFLTINLGQMDMGPPPGSRSAGMLPELSGSARGHMLAANRRRPVTPTSQPLAAAAPAPSTQTAGFSEEDSREWFVQAHFAAIDENPAAPKWAQAARNLQAKYPAAFGHISADTLRLSLNPNERHATWPYRRHSGYVYHPGRQRNRSKKAP